MAKRHVFDFTVETSVPLERVMAAATDFSPNRPEWWPLVTKKQYKVFSQGDHEAEVEEGTAPAHHRARYTWTADSVRATTVDASGVAPGSSWDMQVHPRDGGGAQITCHYEFEFRPTPFGLMGRTMAVLRPSQMQRWFMRTVRILEEEQADAGGGA